MRWVGRFRNQFPKQMATEGTLRNYVHSRFLVFCRGQTLYDDVIKWKHFPRYWPFVRGIHRSPVNSSHKGQWRAALMFSLICAWINGWVNNNEAGDLRRHRAHYDVIVMQFVLSISLLPCDCHNHNIGPLAVKRHWRIWVTKSHEHITLKLPTPSAANNENSIKITTFSFQWTRWLWHNNMKLCPNVRDIVHLDELLLKSGAYSEIWS